MTDDLEGIEEVIPNEIQTEISTETQELTSESIEDVEASELSPSESMTATDRIKELIQEKINQGFNFKIKDQKVSMCKEIANQVKSEFGTCSYQAVQKYYHLCSN